jgi:GNAT superfamily N-acetyltransferase
MSTTYIRRVSHSEILLAPNAQHLIDEYAAECSIPQIGKINQQPETYAKLEAAGLMSCFGVFAKLAHSLDEPELVGFASVLMTELPHYGRKVATVESLFLARSHRPGGTGRALMDAVEAHAKENGCVAILYSAPEDSQFHFVLAFSRKYNLTNLVFCRSLA